VFFVASGVIIAWMPDQEKVGTPGGPRSGGMEPQQAHANNYAKLVQAKQAAITKAAKDLAPKEKAAPQRQPQKDRGGPER
jgi:hypothetical protein